MNKGTKHKKESIEKMRLTLKGRVPWNKNKSFPQMIGNKHRLGKTPWNKNKKGLQIAWNKKELIKLSCFQCNKEFFVPNYRMNKAKFCSMSCINKGKSPWNKNLKNWMSIEGKQRMIQSKIGKPTWNKDKKLPQFSGENNPRWNPDREYINNNADRGHKSPEYAKWRIAVFKKDDYRCMDCGERNGNIEADHIYQWSKYPRLRYEILNGQTLCESCHLQKTRYERTGRMKLNNLITI